jgi:hypothetical protein
MTNQTNSSLVAPALSSGLLALSGRQNDAIWQVRRPGLEPGPNPYVREVMFGGVGDRPRLKAGATKRTLRPRELGSSLGYAMQGLECKKAKG